jgi:hypothetical protein
LTRFRVQDANFIFEAVAAAAAGLRVRVPEDSMISESLALTVTGRLTVTVAPRLTHAATRAGSTVTVGRDVAQAQAPSQTPPHWQASVPALAP